jgi:hypothetical protein
MAAWCVVTLLEASSWSSGTSRPHSGDIGVRFCCSFLVILNMLLRVSPHHFWHQFILIYKAWRKPASRRSMKKNTYRDNITNP